MSCVRACQGQTSRPNGSATPGSPAGGGAVLDRDRGMAPRLHEELLVELRRASHAGHGRPRDRRLARQGAQRGAHTGPSPVDRSRSGSKHHAIVDRHGTPLTVSLTGGNQHDITQLIPLLDAIARIRGRRGRPHHKPKRLHADRGCDFRRYRRLLRVHGIVAKIARRRAPHGSGLGKTVGWQRELLRGCISSSACASAQRDAPTSTRDSSNSPAPSPA